MPQLLRELPGPNMGTVHTPRITSTALLLVGQAKVAEGALTTPPRGDLSPMAS